MNTAFAGAGKTYTAGGNIAITSSNNAISVVKNGAVKSGDTGIVTGGTVFGITGDLESSLTLQNTRLGNLSASISSKDTSLGTINTSVNGLQSNVNSAVASLNIKAQNYLRNDFKNISDAGKTKLSSLITSSIKNYKDNLTGDVSASTASNSTVDGSSVSTFESKGVPTVSETDREASNTVTAGAIEKGNTGTVTGGDIYTASLSGTIGNGSPMVNAGLSFKIGYGKHVEKAVVNKADYEALQGQVKQLNQLIKDLNA